MLSKIRAKVKRDNGSKSHHGTGSASKTQHSTGPTSKSHHSTGATSKNSLLTNGSGARPRDGGGGENDPKGVSASRDVTPLPASSSAASTSTKGTKPETPPPPTTPSVISQHDYFDGTSLLTHDSLHYSRVI